MAIMKKSSPLFTIAAHEYVMIYRDKIVLLLALIAWICWRLPLTPVGSVGNKPPCKKTRQHAMFRHEWEEQQALILIQSAFGHLPV